MLSITKIKTFIPETFLDKNKRKQKMMKDWKSCQEEIENTVIGYAIQIGNICLPSVIDVWNVKEIGNISNIVIQVKTKDKKGGYNMIMIN